MLIIDLEGQRVETEGVTFDFSRFGVGVRAAAGLAPGQIVDVVPSEGKPYSVRSRVVWVGPAESDQDCKAGLEFLQALPAPV
jgi:hypothetical protein